MEVEELFTEVGRKRQAIDAGNNERRLMARKRKAIDAVNNERRLRYNIAARLKYVENPEKFADSEVDLNDELQKLKVLAGAPELYPELVASNTVPSIVNLLSHENADIANDVVQLLHDLTDEDALEDNDEPARVLVDALVENNVLELLVQNMNRLSEADADEATAIYATLTVIENLVEVKPAVAELVCERTKLLRWLLLKIKVRDFEGIKQYASEILAILLQNSTANQKRLGQMNGVDAVLEGVAMYKSKDPKTPDEEEMLENLFDCLCCLLMPLENKERFVNAEGVELMIIIMKQKKYAYGSALRALDFAMTNYPPACERFVDVVGLKTAFAAFMDKVPLNKKIKRERYKEELEERVISLIASLFAGILRGSRRDPLLSNFVENDYEKIDRLMELYIRYSDRVRSEAERLDQLELDDLELNEDEKYNRKLESGIYSLQLIAVILGHIWCSEHSGMRARIELLLKQQKLNKNDIKEILQEYHDDIGDPKTDTNLTLEVDGGSSLGKQFTLASWRKKDDGGSSWGKPDDGGSSSGKRDHGGSSHVKNDAGNKDDRGLWSGKGVDGGSSSGKEVVDDHSEGDEFTPVGRRKRHSPDIVVDIFLDLETVAFRDAQSVKSFRNNVDILLNAKPSRPDRKYSRGEMTAYVITGFKALVNSLLVEGITVCVFKQRKFLCRTCSRRRDEEMISKRETLGKKPKLLEIEMLVDIGRHAVHLQRRRLKGKTMMIISNDPFFKNEVCSSLTSAEIGGLEVFTDFLPGANVDLVFLFCLGDSRVKSITPEQATKSIHTTFVLSDKIDKVPNCKDDKHQQGYYRQRKKTLHSKEDDVAKSKALMVSDQIKSNRVNPTVENEEGNSKVKTLDEGEALQLDESESR